MEFSFSTAGFLMEQMGPASCLNISVSGGRTNDSFPEEYVECLREKLDGKKVAGSNLIYFPSLSNEKSVGWGYSAAETNFSGSVLDNNLSVYMQIRRHQGLYTIYLVDEKGVKAIKEDMVISGKSTPLQLDRQNKEKQEIPFESIALVSQNEMPKQINNLANKIKDLAGIVNPRANTAILASGQTDEEDAT